jgi:hypothetical protein
MIKNHPLTGGFVKSEVSSDKKMGVELTSTKVKKSEIRGRVRCG